MQHEEIDTEVNDYIDDTYNKFIDDDYSKEVYNIINDSQ